MASFILGGEKIVLKWSQVRSKYNKVPFSILKSSQLVIPICKNLNNLSE